MKIKPHACHGKSVTGSRLPLCAAILGAIFVAGGFGGANTAFAASPAIKAEIAKQHEVSVKRLQDWIALPSIAAENLNYPEGPEYMMKLALDAGFQHAEIIPTKGRPGVFATLDAGAEKTLALYFMYDVKQFDPSEWSSPPLEGRLVHKPGFGKVMIGRGAVNQKGPNSAVLAALHAIRDSGQKMPVNIVLVAEGEEEIGSPNIADLVMHPKVKAALSKSLGIILPYPLQGPDGVATVNLGAKGVVEVELVATGKAWGRGPDKDIHSSYKAMVDAPAWHLVKALSSLVSEDGNTITIDDFPKAAPLTAEEKDMIAGATKIRSEEAMKKLFGVSRWIDDLPWQEANERLVSQPTLNIEGMVSGYTGEGGKTILPSRASAKLDFRLTRGMSKDMAVSKLKAHLANHGYGDIEVIETGGYNSTSTAASTALIQAQVSSLKNEGLEVVMWPRGAGSFPGYIFSDPPLNLPVGGVGVGHGGLSHVPDEYFVIESENPKIKGYDAYIEYYVDFLYELAK